MRERISSASLARPASGIKPNVVLQSLQRIKHQPKSLTSRSISLFARVLALCIGFAPDCGQRVDPFEITTVASMSLSNFSAHQILLMISGVFSRAEFSIMERSHAEGYNAVLDCSYTIAAAGTPRILQSISEISATESGRRGKSDSSKHSAALGRRALNHCIQIIKNQLTTGTAENLGKMDIAVQNCFLHLRNEDINCKGLIGRL